MPAVAGAEAVVIGVAAHALTLAAADLLVETEVDAAEDPRVVDVVGDRAEAPVAQRQAGQGGSGEGDGVASAAVEALQDLARGASRRGVGRGITRVARRGDERREGRTGRRAGVVVGGAGPD